MNSTMTVAEERQATRDETFHQRLCSLEILAGPLVRAAFLAAVVSLVASGVVWALLFGKYAVDSLTSAVLCTLILVLLAVPGTVLLGLWQSLRDVTRIRAAAGASPTPPPPAQPAGPRAADLRGRALEVLRSGLARIETLLEIRAQVLFIEEDLARLRSATSTLRLAASPLALVAIAASGALSVLIVLAAVLAVLKVTLQIVF